MLKDSLGSLAWLCSPMQFAFLLLSFNSRHSCCCCFKIYCYLWVRMDYIWKLGPSIEVNPSKLTQRGKGHSPATFCVPCCCCPLSSGEGSRIVGETDISMDKKSLETNVLIIQLPLSDHLHIFQLQNLRLI